MAKTTPRTRKSKASAALEPPFTNVPRQKRSPLPSKNRFAVAPAPAVSSSPAKLAPAPKRSTRSKRNLTEAVEAMEVVEAVEAAPVPAPAPQPQPAAKKAAKKAPIVAAEKAPVVMVEKAAVADKAPQKAPAAKKAPVAALKTTPLKKKTTKKVAIDKSQTPQVIRMMRAAAAKKASADNAMEVEDGVVNPLPPAPVSAPAPAPAPTHVSSQSFSAFASMAAGAYNVIERAIVGSARAAGSSFATAMARVVSPKRPEPPKRRESPKKAKAASKKKKQPPQPQQVDEGEPMDTEAAAQLPQLLPNVPLAVKNTTTKSLSQLNLVDKKMANPPLPPPTIATAAVVAPAAAEVMPIPQPHVAPTPPPAAPKPKPLPKRATLATLATLNTNATSLPPLPHPHVSSARPLPPLASIKAFTALPTPSPTSWSFSLEHCNTPFPQLATDMHPKLQVPLFPLHLSLEERIIRAVRVVPGCTVDELKVMTKCKNHADQTKLYKVCEVLRSTHQAIKWNGKGIQCLGPWRHYPGYVSDEDCMTVSLLLNEEDRKVKEAAREAAREAEAALPQAPPTPDQEQEDCASLPMHAQQEYRVLEFLLNKRESSRQKDGVVEDKLRDVFMAQWNWTVEEFYKTMVRLTQRKLVWKSNDKHSGKNTGKNRFSLNRDSVTGTDRLFALVKTREGDVREEVVVRFSVFGLGTNTTEGYVRVLMRVKTVSDSHTEAVTGTTQSGRAVRAPKTFVAEACTALSRTLRLNERAERDAKELEDTWEARYEAQIRRKHAARQAEARALRTSQNKDKAKAARAAMAIKSDEAKQFEADDFRFSADELEDLLGGRTASGRFKRITGGNPMEKANFAQLIEMILANSHEFEAQGRILRLKNYMPADATPLEIDLIIAALKKNTRIEVVYIQNFEKGMLDEQLFHLVELLRHNRHIWAVNVGENYQISYLAWEWFIDNLPLTSIGYIYVSEHHIDGDTKKRIIDLVRANRKRDEKDEPRDPEVCLRVGNMWWNPPVRDVVNGGVRPNIDGLYDEEQLKELQGAVVATDKPPTYEERIANGLIEVCRRTRGRRGVSRDEFMYVCSTSEAYRMLNEMVQTRRIIQIGKLPRATYIVPEHQHIWERENGMMIVFEGDSYIATTVRGYAPLEEQLLPREVEEVVVAGGGEGKDKKEEGKGKKEEDKKEEGKGKKEEDKGKKRVLDDAENDKKKKKAKK